MARAAGSDLQLPQDLAFQRRDWLFERVGWTLWALILLAGLCGLFGADGVLNRRTALSDELKIDFQPYARHEYQTVLTLSVPKSAVAGDHVSVWFDRSYWDEAKPESFSPQPSSMTKGSDRVTCTFAVDDVDDSVDLSCQLRFSGYGSITGKIGLDGRSGAEFTQFIYP